LEFDDIAILSPNNDAAILPSTNDVAIRPPFDDVAILPLTNDVAIRPPLDDGAILPMVDDVALPSPTSDVVILPRNGEMREFFFDSKRRENKTAPSRPLNYSHSPKKSFGYSVRFIQANNIGLNIIQRIIESSRISNLRALGSTFRS